MSDRKSGNRPGVASKKVAKPATDQASAVTTASARKSGAKKTTAKKAPAAKKPAAPKKAAAKKGAAKKGAAKKTTPAKKAAVAKKAAAPKKAAPKKAAPAKKVEPANKAEPVESAKKKAPATKAPATKAPATKAPATKAPATKAPATKAAPTKKSVAKKAPAAKTAAAKAAPQARKPTAGTDRAEALVVAAGESPWTAEELAEVCTDLQTEADRLRAEIAATESELEDVIRGGRDGAGDDQADAGSATFEREHEMSLARNSQELLGQVERALRRIEDGSYGICEGCGKPIGKARAQAFPRATLCVACKQLEERR